MSPIEIALLACGLAVDSALAALAHGLAAGARRVSTAARIALIFGGMQAAMAVAGWWAGAPIASRFERYDHWVAFAVLLAIGIHTIREGHGEERAAAEPGLVRLLATGLATSLDAFAAGFGLRLIDEPIAPAALAAGLVTAAASLVAFAAAARVPQRWRKLAHWLAGLTLIAIGARIVVAHSGHL